MLTKKNIIELYFDLFFFLVLLTILNVYWVLFDPFINGFQFKINLNLKNYFYIFFGIDALNFFFIYLTTLLISLSILYNIYTKHNILQRIDQNNFLAYIGLLLMLVYSVADILLFYITFESILIPFFVYIGVSGYRQRRIHASYLFFFYTVAGSFFMLTTIIYFYLYTGSTNFEILWNTEYIGNIKYLLWLCLFITFAIKVPMFPFHIWLPEAHVEAPTEGSVILAGLLLKLGIYGMLRFCFPIFPDLCLYFSPLVLMLATIGIIYTSFSTLRQIDIKRIIAYSSISHMNICILGIFSFTDLSIIGALFLMIGHGIISGGLFFIIGMLYSRYLTKIIQYYSGVIYFMPSLCFFFLLFTLGNTGMPTTSNFIGELLIILGISNNINYVVLISISIGILLCSIYSIWLYNKIVFLIPKYNNIIVNDIYLHEFIILTNLVILMYILGVYPDLILSILENNINFNLILNK